MIRKRKAAFVLFFFGCVFLLNGCTIINKRTKQGVGFLTGFRTLEYGTKKRIEISSTPVGASVNIDNVPHGKTPMSVDLSRKCAHVIQLEMEGYKTFEITLAHRVTRLVWVRNLVSFAYTLSYNFKFVFLSFIIFTADATSGALYDFDANEVTPVLEKNDMVFLETKNTAYLFILLQPDKNRNRYEQF